MINDHDNGMPPPTNTTTGKYSLENLEIKRSIVKSHGKRSYIGLPQFEKGEHALWVFVNGKKEYVGEDYDEISNSTINFLKDVPRGATIEFLVFKKYIHKNR